MLKTLKTLAATAVILGSIGAASANELFSTELSIDMLSKYVWRGQLLTDEPVFQAGLTLSRGGWSANIWGSFDITDINEDNQTWRLQEVDYTLSYGFTAMDGLDLEAGVIHYTFPGTSFDSTTEVYGSATLSNIPLSPSLSVFYDVDEVEGFYVVAGIGHDFAVTDQLSLGISAALGWGDKDYNDGYFGLKRNAFNDASVTVSVDYTVNDHFSIGAYLTYSSMIDSKIDSSLGSDAQLTYGGVNFTFAF